MISNKLDSQKSQKLVENNSSSISTPSSLKEEYIFFEKSYSQRKIFEVLHKNEKIFLENYNKKSKSKNSSNILYKCIYCGNAYCNIIRFESHMKMHVSFIYNINDLFIQTGEKPYKCSFCDKTFKEKGNLKVHIRVHTNIRPYHCTFKNICNQSFKTKSQLHDHLLKHTQIKNYNCPECNISFARKSRLKIHMMIHKGLKPFQCNICKKEFREKSNFNFHLKKHHKKSENSKFDIGKNNRNGFNKSNSFSKSEINFKENEIINKGTGDIKDIILLKDQDIIFKNNNLKDSKNIKNNIDNNEIKNLIKDEVLINLSNIFDQLDHDIIFSEKQKKSTDENSYLFNDNTILQKYNIYEKNNIDNSLNSINNEDLCLNNFTNINQFGLMAENNNIEFQIKKKINNDTFSKDFS